MPAPRRYSVVVAKDYLKFAAAHFIAYPGFREPLHGHNYQVSVRVEAELGADGYVLDFGVVKRVAKALCEDLDERVIVPERSDCLTVIVAVDRVEIDTPAARVYAQRCGECHRAYQPGSMTWPMWQYQLGRMQTLFLQLRRPWLSREDEGLVVDYLRRHAGTS